MYIAPICLQSRFGLGSKVNDKITLRVSSFCGKAYLDANSSQCFYSGASFIVRMKFGGVPFVFFLPQRMLIYLRYEAAVQSSNINGKQSKRIAVRIIS